MSSTFKVAPPKWDDIDAGDRITVTGKNSEYSGMHGYVKALRTLRSVKNRVRYSEFYVVIKDGDDLIDATLFENQMIVGWKEIEENTQKLLTMTTSCD